MCLACCHVLQGLITVKVDEMLLFLHPPSHICVFSSLSAFVVVVVSKQITKKWVNSIDPKNFFLILSYNSCCV